MLKVANNNLVGNDRRRNRRDNFWDGSALYKVGAKDVSHHTQNYHVGGLLGGKRKGIGR